MHDGIIIMAKRIFSPSGLANTNFGIINTSSLWKDAFKGPTMQMNSFVVTDKFQHLAFVAEFGYNHN